MFRWSDLEYILAVAGKGSVAAAARALGVNHTTVLRRVQKFEERHNIRIFERLRSGYRLTPKGEIFVDAALSIEGTVAELDRKIAGNDTALGGTLSITTTDSIFPFLAADLGALQRTYSELVVDVTITNDRLNLDTRDADIAIRASSSPPPHLVGRRVCDLNFRIYASRDVLEQEAAIPLESRRWLGIDAPLTATVVGAWMAENIAPAQIALRSNSFIGLRDLAVQGLGHAILPCQLGDAAPELVRVRGRADGLTTGLWLLSHPDVLRSRRVRAGTDFLYEVLKLKRAAFEGT